jgi:lipopolysaccharide export system permease protein
MIPGTLSRYFGAQFIGVVISVFSGLLLLVMMIDFVEMLRRTSNLKDVSTLVIAEITFYRVFHITEQVMPFTVLTAAMACFLNLSRRLELVVARSAGLSAWQFIRPAVVVALLIGVVGTTLYNPLAAYLREQSKRLEARLYGVTGRSMFEGYGGFWVRQRSTDGQAIINAKTSRQQGVELSGVTVFTLDNNDGFISRIEAKRATLREGHWHLEEARIYRDGMPPSDQAALDLATSLTIAQVQESFATPETVPFWQLSSYIQLAENSGLAAAGYRLQYYQLLALPFYLAAMVLLAAAVSLRLFRFGGVQKMVLIGIAAGFLLYVLSKITGDLSKAGLMPTLAAAALPPFVGGVTALTALLYQEDG